MRVLLLRPREQADATARRLALRGHAAIVAPILEIEEAAGIPPDVDPEALVVTSANAAPALVAVEAWRSRPLFAVGRRSADRLIAGGFTDVRCPEGDASRLAAEIRTAIPAGARLLLVAGRDRKAEPERSLREAGFEVVVWEAYAAEAAATLPTAAAEALSAGEADAVLHYSRRSAETFVTLAREAGLADTLCRPIHVCLSDDVGAGLTAAGEELRTVVANGPTENALLIALDTAQPVGARAAGGTDAMSGTNSRPDDFRTTPIEDPRMSEPRPTDPLRREPPTIDLKAESTPLAADTAAAAKVSPSEEATTAIEPVATTALGLKPFPADVRDPPSGPGPAPKPASVPSAGSSGRSADAATGASSAAATTAAAAASSPASSASKAAETKAEPTVPKPAPSVTSGPAGKPAEAPKAAGPARAAAPEAPTTARPAGAGLLAAGLLGGVIGAGLLFGIERSFFDDGTADRLARLEQRVGSGPSGASDARLASLEAGVRSAQDAATQARTAAQQAASRPASAGDPSGAAGLGALTGKVDAVDQRSAANAAAIRDLSAKTETAVSAAALSTAIGPIDSGLKSANSGLGDLRGRTEGLDKRIGSLAQEVGKISPGSVQAALRIVVAGRLDEALRTGAPLKPSLDALNRLGADDATLAALRPYADAPPASAAVLAQEFKPLADKMLEQPQTADSGIGDRLLRVAEKIVTVRVISDGAGQDLPARVGRIQSALARGDLGSAASAWDQLPDGAKTMSSAWAQRLKGRVAADAASRRIASDALASIDTAAPR